MPKENTPGSKQVSETSQGANTTKPAVVTTTPSGKNRSGKKNKRLQVGGTAAPGAKSMQPKQTSSTNNPQQQEIEGYNRTMRRRMQQMGTGPYAGEQQKVKTQQQKRKEKIERRVDHFAGVSSLRCTLKCHLDCAGGYVIGLLNRSWFLRK